MLFGEYVHLPFWSPVYYFWVPLFAWQLDRVIGDPPTWPHPVRWVGNALQWMESKVRKGRITAASGLICLGGLALVVSSLICLLVALPYGVGLLVALYLSYAGLALGDLLRQGRKAAWAIRCVELEKNIREREVRQTGATLAKEHAALEDARLRVSYLVSRDVSRMGPAGLYRSLAESLSENFNDGFVAPYFWLVVTGPVGLWVYKTVSTMDSMWGYKNNRFLLLGKAGARTDDVLAYIPARLAALFLYLAGEIALPRSGWHGWRRVIQQAGTMESPNAGLPMAVAAWVCHGRMGGPTPYAGKLVQKPILGPEQENWEYRKLTALCNTISTAGTLTAISISGLGWLVAFWLL